MEDVLPRAPLPRAGRLPDLLEGQPRHRARSDARSSRHARDQAAFDVSEVRQARRIDYRALP